MEWFWPELSFITYFIIFDILSINFICIVICFIAGFHKTQNALHDPSTIKYKHTQKK